MRICIDLDGVIASIDPQLNYFDRLPIPDAKSTIKDLRSQGHYIILHTARHMKTTESNLGKVLALQGQITLDWLKKHDIEFDEIYFGKPFADIYIDDNALRFENWSQVRKVIGSQ